MITPRETFQNSPVGKGWQDVVDSARFHAAASAALLEMNLRLSSTPDYASSAAAQKKKEGALLFLELLMGLSLPAPAQRRASESENLDHRV